MIQVKIFTLSFSSPLGWFDDSAIAEFIKDKDVISVREHFFTKDEMPYWAIMILYHGLSLPPTPADPKKEKEDDYRKRLTNEDWPLFNTLKTWRAERAKAEGIPPYLICTNHQLVDMVLKRPSSRLFLK